jgi:hypothetical protein
MIMKLKREDELEGFDDHLKNDRSLTPENFEDESE